MSKDITKKCRSCELNFNRLKNKGKSQDFKIPKDIPVSESMRNSINKLRGNK